MSRGLSFQVRRAATAAAAGLTLLAAPHGASTAPAGPRIAAAPAEASGQAYDLTSAITGRTYRIFVSIPSAPPPPGGFPVLYLLDGNWNFLIASQTSGLQGATGEAPRAVIVGLGYPVGGAEVRFARVPDLTLTNNPDQLPKPLRDAHLRTGDADAFFQALVTEIRPFVESKAPIDKGCQTLFGHSLGGLFTLHALFKHPEAFRTYVAASPSIWWDDNAVLNDEAAFETALRGGKVRARLLMTAGEGEQPGGYRPPPPKGQFVPRMVDNMRDLAQRLAPYQGDNFELETWVFPGETHNASVPAAISKTLRFGLCKAKTP